MIQKKMDLGIILFNRVVEETPPTGTSRCFSFFLNSNYQMHFGDAFMPWWLVQLFHLIKTQSMWNPRDRSGDAQPATKTQHGRSWGEDAAGLLYRVDLKKGSRNTTVKVDGVWLPTRWF